MSNYSEVVKKKFLATLDEYDMLSDADKVVVGFSGGADSVCLLSLFNTYKEKLGVKVVAAHINHGIRGDEATRDSRFARDYCKKNGIEFHLCEVDCIKQAHENGETVEEAGRRIRYGFFSQICTNYSKIATAHNSNDNVETVLFNLTRGTSLKGVCGIPPVRDNIIRPIIKCTREEIEGYCAENNLEYVTDSTNLSNDYTRNKIRHLVLPVLKEINPNVCTNVASFCESVGEIDNFLEAETDSALTKALISQDTYDAQFLKSLPKAVLSRVIIKIFSEFCDKKLDRKKVNALCDLLQNGGRYQIYGNVFAEATKDKFRFFINTDTVVDDIICVEEIPFSSAFGGFEVGISKYTNSSKKIHQLVLDNLMDYDKIYGKIFLRSRKSGDEFTLYKRKITKTLKKLFNEAGVPIEKRDSVPVLCDEKGVVWVYGFGVNARCRVTSESTDIILVRGKDNDRQSNE